MRLDYTFYCIVSAVCINGKFNLPGKCMSVMCVWEVCKNKSTAGFYSCSTSDSSVLMVWPDIVFGQSLLSRSLSILYAAQLSASHYISENQTEQQKPQPQGQIFL